MIFMNQRTKVIFTFTVLVVLIFGLYLFTDWFSKVTGYALGEDEKMNLAQCLSKKGAVFYTSPTCLPCLKQKEQWSDESLKLLIIIECKSVDDCPDVGGVPSWKISGQFYYENLNLKEIKRISGC